MVKRKVIKKMGIDRKYRELAKFTQKIETVYLKGVSPELFTKTLERLKINVVVDIRHWSLYPIYFSQKFMKDLLETHGIEYLRLKNLGNPSILRKRAGENFVLAKKLYQEHITSNPASKQELIKLFKQFRFRKKFCLICYCPTLDIKLCHRFWLKELLINLKRNSLGLIGLIELENFSQKLIPEVIS